MDFSEKHSISNILNEDICNFVEINFPPKSQGKMIGNLLYNVVHTQKKRRKTLGLTKYKFRREFIRKVGKVDLCHFLQRTSSIVSRHTERDIYRIGERHGVQKVAILQFYSTSPAQIFTVVVLFNSEGECLFLRLYNIYIHFCYIPSINISKRREIQVKRREFP